MKDKKVLNIKMYEEDFEMIQIIILNHIVTLQHEFNDNLKDEEKDMIQHNVLKEKMLIAKLRTCKLYNKD